MSAPTVATARNTVANPTSRPAPSATRGVSAETIEAATGPARVGMWRLALVSQRNMPKAHSDSESANMLAASHVGRREFVIFSYRDHCAPHCQHWHRHALLGGGPLAGAGGHCTQPADQPLV